MKECSLPATAKASWLRRRPRQRKPPAAPRPSRRADVGGCDALGCGFGSWVVVGVRAPRPGVLACCATPVVLASCATRAQAEGQADAMRPHLGESYAEIVVEEMTRRN